VVDVLKMHWYRNMFIELLIEKWIIDKPMLIYSPWRLESSMNNRLLTEWLYINKTWHVFYDPTLFQNDMKPDLDKVSVSIKLPDLLTYAILSKTVPELCHMIKPFLSSIETCKSYENELITE